MIGIVAVGLALLQAVDAAEADTLRVLVVQDFEGVAVKDTGDITGDFAVVSPNKRNSLSTQISMRRARLEEAREISWAPQVIRYLIG